MCENPSGSESWTVQQWLNYFYWIQAGGEDWDEQLDQIWVGGDPCDNIPCVSGWDDEWKLVYGGPVEVTWSMPNGPPDLTTPGTYTFRATYTNLPDTVTEPPPWLPCEPDWVVDHADPPVTRDCTVTVVPTGKCCQIVNDVLIGGCSIKTEEDCLDQNTSSPPEYVFAEGGPCCDCSGACWEYLANPSPCVNWANAECCSIWGDQFLPGKLCCGDTEPGEWEDLGAPPCNRWLPKSEATSVIVDSCGHRIEIRCEGPIGDAQYRIYYVDAGDTRRHFGTCVYPGGINRFRYQWTDDRRRFYRAYHRTMDNKDGGVDCGTIGKYDWTIHYYDCISENVVPGYPKCCEDVTDPDEAWFACNPEGSPCE